MKLPEGLTAQEIRVLQEYRRVEKQSLTNAEIEAIKHPAGGGLAPAHALVGKGYLTSDGSAFHLADRASEILSFESKPYAERGE